MFRRPMERFLIDATGPFFRGYGKQRVNWSKIPFLHLATRGPERRVQWDRIREDMRRFGDEVTRIGCNAVTLDDLAHLAPHALHEVEVAERIAVFREEFHVLFDLLRDGFGLKIHLTTDVLPSTPALAAGLGSDPRVLEEVYGEMIDGLLGDFPQLEGLILRIGESDGNDVRDPIRTRLHLRDPEETNGFLKRILPTFERHQRSLILRTWTVGAHRIGDLMWNRRTLEATLDGIDSPRFIVSMKPGESDFFRYLPLSEAFRTVRQQKMLELQARREYEGAGEYPAFIGRDCERYAEELSGVEGMVGISIWCQTGGWHRFRRLAFLEDDGRDVWIRMNVGAAMAVFRHGRAAEAGVREVVGESAAGAAVALLDEADRVIDDLLYIGGFARERWFFRRVQVPPLLHVYWDTLFINHAVRKLMRQLVDDGEEAVRSGERAAERFPRMLELAEAAGLPVEDLEHMRDFFGLVLLARRYYFEAYDEGMAERIVAAKRQYKLRWKDRKTGRYRVKISFAPFRLRSRTLSLMLGLLLRRRQGYRWIDRWFTLHVLGVLFRRLKPRDPKRMPKFLRKSAMGVDSLFK